MNNVWEIHIYMYLISNTYNKKCNLSIAAIAIIKPANHKKSKTKI